VLIDGSGKEIISTLADGDPLKEGVPDGNGFRLPVPYEWLADPLAETQFQFRIVETGEVFPKEPRVLSAAKMLRKLDRLTESKFALRKKILAATERLDAIPADKLLVVGIHEMDRTGAPMIALEIVRHLKRDHGREIVLLCNGGSGVLAEQFEAQCALVVTDLERAAKVAEKSTRALYAHLAARSGDRPALINSICSTHLVESCAAAGMRVVSLVHEYPHAFEAEWMRSHLGLVERVVFPCRDVQESFVSDGLIPANGTAVSIVPQGCYLLEMPPAVAAETEAFVAKFRAENFLSSDDRLVVACGTIDLRKGFEWFAALIREYARNSPNAETTHFLWIGRVGDESLFQHALHDLRQHGVIGHFHHLDEVEDVRAALGQADVFLLCSRIDPFPSVVLESISSGVPVIGFDKGNGCRELITESGFGTLVPYQDFAESIKAIDALLSPDSEKAQAVKSRGAQFVAEQYSYRDYVSKLVELLLGEGS
jgi:glycosyltransferase involved in cell wall biosynthesis